MATKWFAFAWFVFDFLNNQVFLCNNDGFFIAITSMTPVCYLCRERKSSLVEIEWERWVSQPCIMSIFLSFRKWHISSFLFNILWKLLRKVQNSKWFCSRLWCFFNGISTEWATWWCYTIRDWVWYIWHVTLSTFPFYFRIFVATFRYCSVGPVVKFIPTHSRWCQVLQMSHAVLLKVTAFPHSPQG